MKTSDLFQSVTDRIVADLEQNNPIWVQPWKSQRTGMMPANYSTGRAYSGINVPILWYSAQDNLFSSNEWMTFNQAIALGGSIRTGSRGTHIVFAKPHVFNPGEEDEKKVHMLRTFVVFNVAQIGGLLIEEHKQIPADNHTMKEFVAETGAVVRYGGDRAFYSPSADIVAMPYKDSFYEESGYWATFLHELSHWTGAKTRLDRAFGKRFGDDAYAIEELVAELSAAFLCAHLGIKGELRHAGYLKVWIGVLKSDSRAIFTAASHASRAADYLRSFKKEASDGESAERDGSNPGAGRTEVQAAG